MAKQFESRSLWSGRVFKVYGSAFQERCIQAVEENFRFKGEKGEHSLEGRYNHFASYLHTRWKQSREKNKIEKIR